MSQMWKPRHGTGERLVSLRPGSMVIGTGLYSQAFSISSCISPRRRWQRRLRSQGKREGMAPALLIRGAALNVGVQGAGPEWASVSPPRLPQQPAPQVLGCAAWAWARDPGRRAGPHAHPPSRGWWQVSGCRGTARQRRKQDAAEIRLLTCSCGTLG